LCFIVDDMLVCGSLWYELMDRKKADVAKMVQVGGRLKYNQTSLVFPSG